MIKNKNIVIICSLLLILALVFIFALAYKYQNTAVPDNKSSPSQLKEDNMGLQDQGVKVLEPKIEGGDSGGFLTICADKCGDGVCQETDADCDNNLNCICQETSQECPQDCK